MNVNKWSIILGSVAIAAWAGGAQAERTLTYGSYLAGTHSTNKTSVEPWIKAVESQTGGALKINLMADGTIIGAKDAVAGVRDDLVDMAMIVDFYTPNELKSSTLLTELGLLGTDEAAMLGAVNEMQLLNCPSCIKEAEENNIKLLGMYASAPYSLICNKEFPTLESLNGARIRATGAWAQFATSVGATPVNITSAEMYEALQRGQVDCTTINIPALTNYSLSEVAKYVIDQPVGTFHGAIVYDVNLNTWNSLSDDERKAMIDNLPMALAGLIEGSYAENKAAREAGTAAGVVFGKPDDALVAHLDTYRKSEVERAIALGTDRGIEDPAAMLAKFQELIAKWEGIVKEVDGDMEKYAEALRTNIFDKVE